MTHDIPEADGTSDDVEALRARATDLERQIRTLAEQARTNLVMSELKAEAVRAGMVDLDGLKLLDASTVTVADGGEVVGAGTLMERFRRAKPWLFGAASSTTTAVPPPSQSPRAKHATDMTPEEYRAARAALVRRT
ncbi:MAG: hypothetical protein HIU92_17795 [Proteobacteria bacterium]|nr:hypothetical protein [Pseudomonadota bacterium]